MSIETEYFKRRRPDFRRLEAFGFEKRDGLYYYASPLAGEDFRGELFVTVRGEVSGRVIDLDTDEEYLPIRLADQVGEFVGTVREKYLDFLMGIDEACFVPVHFIYDQANRIEAEIISEYGVTPEFPWEKYPGNGTFKCKSNGKWFAAILTVEYGKLGGPAGVHEDDEVVEAVNLKADPEEMDALTSRDGIYPAYHMNKKHWISVILDDTLPDSEVMELIRKSHCLAGEGGAKKVAGTGAWMIPSNPKVYNVDAGFRGGRGVIEWHQHNNIKPGDEVYIYCSAPFSALIYRCEVVESDIPYKGMFQKEKGYRRAMRIRLIEKYPPDRFPLSFIKEHGGSVVRSARSMPAELYEAMRKKNGL